MLVCVYVCLSVRFPAPECFNVYSQYGGMPYVYLLASVHVCMKVVLCMRVCVFVCVAIPPAGWWRGQARKASSSVPSEAAYKEPFFYMRLAGDR